MNNNEQQVNEEYYSDSSDYDSDWDDSATYLFEDYQEDSATAVMELSKGGEIGDAIRTQFTQEKEVYWIVELNKIFDDVCSECYDFATIREEYGATIDADYAKDEFIVDSKLAKHIGRYHNIICMELHDGRVVVVRQEYDPAIGINFSGKELYVDVNIPYSLHSQFDFILRWLDEAIHDYPCRCRLVKNANK
jgi:hypothetical protein